MPDIFDQLSIETKGSKRDIFDEIEEMPSRGRSLISAPVKGAVKGAVDIASMTDPLKGVLGIGGLNPHQQQALERTLPTQKRPLEKGLERAGRLAVTAAGGGESLLAKGVRTGIGAGLGQLAEEMGAPESVQSLAELSAFVSPKFGKQILPKKSQQEAVNYLRSKGLSESQIAPLIKSEKRMKALARFAEKNEKTKDLVKGISERLGEGYENIKTSYAGLKHPTLRGADVTAFDDALMGKLDKINPRFQRLIQADVDALRNKGISGENLINFYQDINAVVKGHEGGKAVLGKLKPIIMEGLEKIDPNLAKDFTKLNEFYAKKAILAKGLKPGFFEDIMSKGKAYGTIGALATGRLGVLKTLLGKEVVGKITSELLRNPRLQNISNQMLKAFRDNEITQAVKYFKAFKDVLAKEDPESANALDFKDL